MSEHFPRIKELLRIGWTGDAARLAWKTGDALFAETLTNQVIEESVNNKRIGDAARFAKEIYGADRGVEILEEHEHFYQAARMSREAGNEEKAQELFLKSGDVCFAHNDFFAGYKRLREGNIVEEHTDLVEQSIINLVKTRDVRDRSHAQIIAQETDNFNLYETQVEKWGKPNRGRCMIK
tara:strand:+ start:2316 stop:2855 length:540 start_codon:yes stop_codon:yes gene_type:complete